MNRRIILTICLSALLFGSGMLQLSFAAEDDANKFNRLFKGANKFNLPPWEDGIHDPDDIGTLSLQTPKKAFESLPKSRGGNRVDWVKALNNGDINPRTSSYDNTKKMTVLDLNIIRQVKGTMPDVVYPHDIHTQWLDCKNCHPKLFTPKKGSNNISMASILMGQYCGVCHGKVAFPLSECRLCHSKKKTKAELEQLKLKRSERKKSSKTLPDKQSSIGMVEDHRKVVPDGYAETAMPLLQVYSNDVNIAAVITNEGNTSGDNAEDAILVDDMVTAKQ